MSDLQFAKENLAGDKTCVLAKGETLLVSTKKGIAPVLGFLHDGVDLKGFSVADRIVGKAAAMLFVKAGISRVYAEVISLSGKAYLESHDIPVDYQTLTEKIINRRGDDTCPMEKIVIDLEDAEEGYEALCKKIRELQMQNTTR